MFFVSLGLESYIPSQDILGIFNIKHTKVKNLLKEYETKTEAIKANQDKKTRSVILTTDGVLIRSTITSETIKKRYEEVTGKATVLLGRDNYIPTEHIKLITPYGSRQSQRIIEEKEEEKKLIDISRQDIIKKSIQSGEIEKRIKGRQSLIILTSDFLIQSYYKPITIVEQLNPKQKNQQQTEQEPVQEKA